MKYQKSGIICLVNSDKMNSSDAINVAKQFAQQVKHKFPVDKVILFGSYAKNRAWEGSDIDICVVSSEFGKDVLKEEFELIKIAMKIDHKISPIAFNSNDINNYWSQLAYEITKYGIQI